jgi:hypothetical protein
VLVAAHEHRAPFVHKTARHPVGTDAPDVMPAVYCGYAFGVPAWQVPHVRVDEIADLDGSTATV